MRAARLHGVRDLRVEELRPGRRSRRAADSRRGLRHLPDRRAEIPARHGRLSAQSGPRVGGSRRGARSRRRGLGSRDRVYGDTYAGYAEFAALPVEPGVVVRPAASPDDLALERAIFVEPFADCLHAVIDQAHLRAGSASSWWAAARWACSSWWPPCSRAARWHSSSRTTSDERSVSSSEPMRPCPASDADGGAAAVILSVGVGELVARCVELVRPGGRVVCRVRRCAANGARSQPPALRGDCRRKRMDRTPPNQRRRHYEAALDALVSGQAPLERLVTGRCGLDGLEDAFADVQALRGRRRCSCRENRALSPTGVDLGRGGVVILDGGVARASARRFPARSKFRRALGTVALLEAPDLAQEVHRRYVRAGADVITTHTWRIDGLEAGAELRTTARQAVQLAREAAEERARPETAVAFSVRPSRSSPRSRPYSPRRSGRLART